MNLTWFLRMARWARRRPSILQLKIVLTVVAIAAAIYGLDHFGLWPDWARMERAPRFPK